MSESGYLEVGRFGSVYGVRGWIRIISETENPENIFTYSPGFSEKPEDGAAFSSRNGSATMKVISARLRAYLTGKRQSSLPVRLFS